MNRYQRYITDLLQSVGLEDALTVKDERFWKRLYYGGSLAFGESYMDGWWKSNIPLQDLYAKLLTVHPRDLRKALSPLLVARIALWQLSAQLIDFQNPRFSKRVAKHHYDLSNELYETMLGPTMQYTCAYYRRGAQTLDQAQTDKLHLVAEKLKLEPGMKVVEFGGGFGTLAEFLARKYGAKVTVYNISREQIKYGRKRCKDLGDQVTFIEADYRTAKEHPEAGTFDRFVSVGLLEHVGPHNYKQFYTLLASLIHKDGFGLTHTITGDSSTHIGDPWSDRYIFAGGVIPSRALLQSAIEKATLRTIDVHTFGFDYHKTLGKNGWYGNFLQAWPHLKHQFDERFYRMWELYLLSFEGAFQVGHLDLIQHVVSPQPLPEYKAVR